MVCLRINRQVVVVKDQSLEWTFCIADLQSCTQLICRVLPGLCVHHRRGAADTVNVYVLQIDMYKDPIVP